MAMSQQLSYEDSASEDLDFNTFKYEKKMLESLAKQKCQHSNYKVPANSKASLFYEYSNQHPVAAGRVNVQLKDLLQISLGSDKLTDTNIALLFSLLNILLKKLDCENEVVSIGGFEGQCVKKLLESSKPSPLAFNADTVNILAHKIESFEDTQEKVKVLSELFYKHMQDIERCRNVPPLILRFDEWEAYNQPCEATYIRCDPDNGIACQLLHNTDFLHKLMRRIAYPMVERIFQLEDQIEKLGQQLEAFIEDLKQQLEKLVLVDGIIAELEQVKQQIQENYMKFIGSLEEIQDMMDSKLDKIHMPVLKKFLKETFEKIDKQLADFKSETDCSKAAGIIMNGLSCVSCGNNKVCSEMGVIPVATLPAFGVGCCDAIKKKKECGCFLSGKSCENTLMERIKSIDKENVKLRVQKANGTNDVFLISGNDGNLYRGDNHVMPKP